ncbi:MAG: response regulator [Spirochaetaceae bacterium]|nr:response regulator [Spirochaetaceae bacterium]MCF7949431.1 response regulator [Spirochaetia bacterium]MCF7951366.1 response regulator [Spirochaetaceae bacterium]
MKLNTLIVDDDEMVLTLLGQYLKERDNLNVQKVNNPTEALKIINQEKVHIMILDIVMPEMDGITLLEEAKKVDPLTHVIMMTADSTLGRVIESLGYGAMDFVMKPFESPEAIVSVVDVSIQRWERWNRVLKKTAKKTLSEE